MLLQTSISIDGSSQPLSLAVRRAFRMVPELFRFQRHNRGRKKKIVAQFEGVQMSKLSDAALGAISTRKIIASQHLSVQAICFSRTVKTSTRDGVYRHQSCCALYNLRCQLAFQAEAHDSNVLNVHACMIDTCEVFASFCWSYNLK